jgi:hypothetical protein
VVGDGLAGEPLVEVGPADAAAEGLPELALGRLEQHVAVLGLVGLVAHAVAHAAGAGRAPLAAVAGVAGDLVGRPLVGLPRLAAQPVDGGRGVGLGHLHVPARAGLARLQHGGEQAEGAEQRAGVDADRRLLDQVGEALVVDGGGGHPGPGVVGEAVAGHVPVRPGHAEARHRDQHDAGVRGPQGVEAEAPARQAAGPHGLDHGVGPAHQVEEHGAALVRAQVEHDRPLAPVDVEVHQRGALDDGPGHPPHVVAARRLDLDHLGAEVRQVGRDRGRAEHRALHDAHPGQRGAAGRAHDASLTCMTGVIVV